MTPELLRQLQLILQHQQSGLSPEAEALAIATLQIWPRQPQVMMVLGMICSGQRRFDEAIAWLQQAASASPDETKIWTNYGYALKSAGRIEEAMAAYDRAVALDPNYLQGRLNRAVLLAEMHRIDEAIAQF